MRPVVGLLLFLATACGGKLSVKDSGPAPAEDHQEQVQLRVEGLLNEKHRLAGPSTFRFEAPVKGRVARWHFEPEFEGQPQSLGYVHGWCVEFHVTPNYVGYPEQPESHRMAFYSEGELRGIFLVGLRRAPLELDKWASWWVDPDWHPNGSAQPPR
jgi:hypothetical protein